MMSWEEVDPKNKQKVADFLQKKAQALYDIVSRCEKESEQKELYELGKSFETASKELRKKNNV